MLGYLTEPDVLIVLASGTFVLGYLLINQVMLRLVLLLGTALYIAYYSNAAEAPLWGAIYASMLTGTANLIGLASLLYSRSRHAVPRRHRPLYASFGHIPPGDFAQIMRHAQHQTTTAPRILTQENARPGQLSYLCRGTARVEKKGMRFDLPEGVFVGEVAYLLDSPASATVTVDAGAELLVWDRAVIARAGKRNPRFRLALETAISHDMARKVARAVAPPGTDGMGLVPAPDPLAAQ